MKEFIEKLIGRLEELKASGNPYDSYWDEAMYRATELVNSTSNKTIDGVIEIVNQLAEEYNNGWINADVESPTENGKYIVYYRKWTDGNYLPKFDETEIRILRYRNNDWVFPTYGDTEAEKDIHREVLAWQPLPDPFKPKGE